MTNSKVRNSDSAYSICFSQVLLKLFTSLTQIKRYTKFSIVFYSPIILYKPDKQTNYISKCHSKTSDRWILLSNYRQL